MRSGAWTADSSIQGAKDIGMGFVYFVAMVLILLLILYGLTS